MKDAFYDFSWPVAAYEWQPWLDSAGKVVTPKATLLGRLERECIDNPKRFDRHGKNSSPRSNEVFRAYARAERRREELARETGPVLVRLSQEQTNSYRPLDPQFSALFQDFAEVDCRDAGAILRFAVRYGELGLVQQHQTIALQDPSGRHAGWHTGHGESHLSWAIEICHMREALHLSRSRTFDSLRRLKWLCDRHLPDIRTGLSFDRAGEPELSIRPLTLISALWLQFALAIAGDKQFVACKFCKRPVEISTASTGFRSHREFCSLSCKTLDYRKRKRTALRLADAGDGLAAISEKTATPKETVQGWIDAQELSKGSK